MYAGQSRDGVCVSEVPSHDDDPDQGLPAETVIAMTERRPAFTLASEEESYEAFAARLRALAGLPPDLYQTFRQPRPDLLANLSSFHPQMSIHEPWPRGFRTHSPRGMAPSARPSSRSKIPVVGPDLVEHMG